MPPHDSRPPPFPLPAAIVVYLASWCAIASPWLAGRVVIPWDGAAHFYPQLSFLARALHEGDSPFWTPNVFSGSPQIADPQALIFSPPFLLVAALDPSPSLVAFSWATFGALALGGIGVILIGRDRGWPIAAALIAALVFSFGGSAAWRVQHVGQVLSLVHLPLALWCLWRALDRASLAWGVAAGAAIGSMLAMRDQVALIQAYVLAFVVVWYWLAAEERRATVRRTIVPLLACGLVALALAALPVTMTALWSAESNRPAIDFVGAGRGSLHPALLLTFVAPDLFASAGEMANFWGPPSYHWPGTDLFTAQNMGVVYLGALPLMLLLGIGVAGGRLWDRDIRAVSIAAVLVLLFALGWFTPAFRLFYEALPGVALFRRPADATFVLGGLLALMTGHCLARVMMAAERPSPARLVAGAALVAVVFSAAIGVAVWRGRLADAAIPLGFAVLFIALASAALALAMRMPRHRFVAALLLAAVLAADLGWSNRPNGATGLPRAMYAALEPDRREPAIALVAERLARAPARRERVELLGLGFHWPNAGLVHGFDTALGYNPLRSSLYTRATGAGDTIGLPDQRTFSPLFASYRSPLADLLGTRYVLSPVPVETIDRRLAPGDLALLARTSSAYIYENPRALPRVRFATGWRQADFESLLERGRWPDVDIATTALVGAPVESQRDRAPSGHGTASVVSYRNTEILVAVEAESDGILVLHDIWHPWWRATLDGIPVPMLRADVIFRAVRVPAGRHVVRFEFRPLAGAWQQLRARLGR